MSSITAGYQLPTFTGLINHSWSRSLFLHDIEEPENIVVNDRHVDIQVRSGDYFVTLATHLDQLSERVRSHNVRLDLEDAVSDLIYLQEHYKITKK